MKHLEILHWGWGDYREETINVYSMVLLILMDGYHHNRLELLGLIRVMVEYTFGGMHVTGVAFASFFTTNLPYLDGR